MLLFLFRPKHTIAAISKRMVLKNKNVLVNVFTLLEFLAYNCELSLFTQISTKEFLFKISGLLMNKDIDTAVILISHRSKIKSCRQSIVGNNFLGLTKIFSPSFSHSMRGSFETILKFPMDTNLSIDQLNLNNTRKFNRSLTKQLLKESNQNMCPNQPSQSNRLSKRFGKNLY